MQKIFRVAIFLSFISCSGNRPEIISSNNVKSILVGLVESKSDTIEITNQDSILRILRKLNRAHSELLIFRSKYTLTVLYNDGNRQLVLCDSSYMKVEGATYEMSDDIEDILNIKDLPVGGNGMIKK